MRRTKIVCTIGPASRKPETLRRLIAAGMDVARLNLSHGSLDEHAENVERIRSAAGEAGKPVAILADLQGPKLRVGRMAEGGVPLEAGDRVTFVTADVVGRSPDGLPVQNEHFAHLVSPGDRVLLDDGLIDLRVEAVEGDDVHCRVLVGGRLESNKGINLPGISVDLPSLTDKDRDDLAHALEWGADWVALSFVRTAKDVVGLRALVKELSGSENPPPVMAKIEKPQALEHIDAIIEAADGVMVARGDLGIEIPAEEVPMAQKRIIARSNRAGVPVVTATQMLESMIHNPRPTRAEASDVANAILDGTDALMLSEETSVGAYPVEAVRTMVRIACEVESQILERPPQPFRLSEEDLNLSIADAVGWAAREAAHNLKAAAIISPTASGYTARTMSRYRPDSPIIAITPDASVQRRLMLHWGVTPLLAPRSDNTDDMIARAVEAARKWDLIDSGDVVIITAGAARSEPGTTNLMRVRVVE
jgi:pyruvate kinase